MSLECMIRPGEVFWGPTGGLGYTWLWVWWGYPRSRVSMPGIEVPPWLEVLYGGGPQVLRWVREGYLAWTGG